MDVEKKIKQDMRDLGCNCNTKITLAYYLYIHLVDHKMMYDTEYIFNSSLNILYVVGKPSKHAKFNIYVPVPTSSDITMEYIKDLQTNLCTIETGPSINLAFIEGDFTIVIYTFTNALSQWPSAEKIDELKTRQAKRSLINSELKKHKASIVKEAVDGGLVRDDGFVSPGAHDPRLMPDF